MAALNAGGSAVIAERFSVSGFWSDIADNGATSTPLIGAMIELLLRTETPQMAADRARSSIRCILGACPPATHLEVERSWGITPVSAYGLTDFGSITHTSPGDGAPAGTVGRVISAYEVRLVDADGADVPDGVAGELIARPRDPATIPDGYFRMPEATLESRKDLWFHTGDLLKRDAEGWFYFAGRVKDSMRRRGENVSAYDVEAAILGSGQVAEVAAYPLPSGEGDDEIAVAVVVNPGTELDRAELIEAAARELPYFAVPRYVRVVDRLPKTPTQKVQKGPLRDAGITADTWDRIAAGVEVTRNRDRTSAR
jgi:crotonobetaine/carnitine-CoA ligase